MSRIDAGSILLFVTLVGCQEEEAPPLLSPPEELPTLLSTYDLVDPFIGTGGSGVQSPNCFPGAVAPFGMVQASPDTVSDLGAAPWFNHAAGYHFDDTQILGFSHTRLHGTSTPDLGAVLLMPVDDGDPTALTESDGYRCGLAKESERAEPGYYAVTLTSGIEVELTALPRSAHHRYHFPGSAQVVVDLSHALTDTEVLDSELLVVPDDRALEGWVQHCGRESCDSGDGLKTWFHIRFQHPFASWFTWNDGAPTEGVADQLGPEVGAILAFELQGDGNLEVQVGISYVDTDGARANLDADQGSQGFDDSRSAARQLWEDELSSVRFGGGTEPQQRIMATALYHNYIVPNLFGDVDGSYRGFDGEVHVSDGFRYHSSFSMWDTYRTTHPLLILVEPDRQREMVLSLMAMAADGGYLPRWPMGHGYTNSTVGSPVDVVMAESVLKGIDGFDEELALEMMLRTAFEAPEPGHQFSGREGIEAYVELGYVPADVTGRSVSQTLEFAIADAAIARMAEALGHAQDAALFTDRSGNYRNLWDPEIAAFTGRDSDGSWIEIDPRAYEPQSLFYGGNALQHSWLAPHDMAGLVDVHGSAEVFADRLETFFEDSAFEQENQTEITMMAPTLYYHHGNEPDIHAPYLFVAVGRPEATQQWVHWATETFYQDAPDGIAGNEDAGALSAWYVLSALGLYPAAASDLYLVGRPLFPVAEVAVEGGTLRIEAMGADADHPYVHAVTLDGVELPHPWLRHDQIVNGGTLVFTMGDEPGDWGTDFGTPLL